jgi:hypothetical protein
MKPGLRRCCRSPTAVCRTMIDGHSHLQANQQVLDNNGSASDPKPEPPTLNRGPLPVPGAMSSQWSVNSPTHGPSSTYRLPVVPVLSILPALPVAQTLPPSSWGRFLTWPWLSVLPIAGNGTTKNANERKKNRGFRGYASRRAGRPVHPVRIYPRVSAKSAVRFNLISTVGRAGHWCSLASICGYSAWIVPPRRRAR